MSKTLTGPKVEADANPIVKAQGRQILFYSPAGLLGGTFACSRCGASARQPDVIAHAPDCGYGLRPTPPSA